MVVSRGEVASGAVVSILGASHRRTSHWLSGSVMQEIITQMIRMANEKPTERYIGQNVSNPSIKSYAPLFLVPNNTVRVARETL